MKHRAIISRYLLREIFITLLGVAIVLLMIFISGQLVGLYGKAASGALEVQVILRLLGFETISNLVLVLPLAFYIAILLALSRLYKDNEMVVLSACGISPWRIVRTVLILGVLFAILVGWLSLYLAPWSEQQSEVLTKQSEQRGELESLSAGRFKELKKGEGVLYVQEYDQTELRMNNVFVQYKLQEQNSIVSAESGQRRLDDKTGDRFLELYNGFRFDGPGKDGQTAMIEFERHGVRLDEQAAIIPTHFRQKAVPTAELLERGKPLDHGELQWRISAALLCIVLAVLAVPLSRTSPRQGRYSRLALALLIYIIYTNMLNVSRAWLNKGEIHLWVGMWWVHVLGIAIALLLFVQWKPLLRRWGWRH